MKAPSMVMPDGPPAAEEPTTDEKTATQPEGEGSPEEQAKVFYDEIMADDPKVCKALYELLKNKYEGGEKETKKEVASEKGAAAKEEYSQEGMPED